MQDLESTTVATYDTFYNVEQHKKSLHGGGSTSRSFTILTYNAMLSSSSLSSSFLHTHNHKTDTPLVLSHSGQQHRTAGSVKRTGKRRKVHIGKKMLISNLQGQ